MKQVKVADAKLKALRHIIDNHPIFSKQEAYYTCDYVNLALDEFIRHNGDIGRGALREELDVAILKIIEAVK